MSKLIIPEAALQQHVAVLGKTGAGKTSTEKLAVEQVVADGFRVCVLDTVKSDWWGITSSADGKKAGLPFRILGGPHGHVPLHSSAGKAIGQIVGSGKLPLSIIDMADFEAGGIQRFFTDFAPALLRSARGVVYLVIEEAHELAPKERAGFGAENMAIHWAKKIATAGRSKGIRLIVATQRVQALHNAVLGSCETVIAHRLTTPADQEPVIKWLKANADKETVAKVEASLSSLPTGTGWICSGEARIFEQVAFRKFKTFDNTATPTGDAAEISVTTAPVDQDELRSIIGDAVKEAEANDPKLLRAENARLRAELGKKAPVSAGRHTKAELNTEYARGREDGFEAGRINALDQIYKVVRARADTARSCLSRAETEFTRAVAEFGNLHQAIAQAHNIAPQARRAPPATASPQPPRHALQGGPTHPKRKSNGMHPGVTTPQQRILDALAWLESVRIDRADRTQLALLADASPTSSAYANNCGALRSAGLIEYPAGAAVALTDAGRAAANAPETPPTTGTLHETLQRKLSAPQWRILANLIDLYPNGISKDDLAEKAEASPTSSAFANNLGALRTLGFIDYPAPGKVAALPVLFLE